MDSKRARVCVLVASDLTLRAFMRGHLAGLQQHYDVTASANSTRAEVGDGVLPSATVFQRNHVEREIRLLGDAKELLRLVRWFRRERFDVVHTITPKAGLLGMVAARLARVPIRMHTFTGQVWATETGAKRRLLRGMDQLLARCCTHPMTDSHSQLEFLRTERVLRLDAGVVPGEGSIAGVDIERFRVDADTHQELRTRLGIGLDAVAFVFVGRLNRDKGVSDLVPAFVAATSELNDAHLLLVGPDEAGYTQRLIEAAGDQRHRVHFIGPVSDPERYLAAADVFCLPSYREGFGVSVIEAAACGLPAVVSRIYGLTDAVISEQTGLFHEPGDVAGITDCLRRLGASSDLRRQLGDAAQQRVTQDFAADRVTAALVDIYDQALNE